jgi:hypothetical protein
MRRPWPTGAVAPWEKNLMAFTELESLYHPMAGLQLSYTQIIHVLGWKISRGFVTLELVAQLCKQIDYWLRKNMATIVSVATDNIIGIFK